MSKLKKTVADYMTPSPHAVHLQDRLTSAREKMTKVGARHLPVIEDGKVVGVLSDRDLQVALGFKHGNPKSLTVEDVYCADAYVTTPDANLSRVAMHMAEAKIGSAVVVEGDSLVGIFTTTDACRALHDVLAE